jgi:hypothetical protein
MGFHLRACFGLRFLAQAAQPVDRVEITSANQEKTFRQ